MAQRQFRSDDTDSWLERFGNGSKGSTYAVPANEGCSGTSGGTSVTLANAGSFSNGDLVLIHQSRGSGFGTWELNKIASGAGGTSLTMSYDLINTYTDSGDNQAQIIELNQYNGVTVGTKSVPTWDGSKGGIMAFLDNGTTTIDATITGNAKAFTGGTAVTNTGKQGEGTGGAGGTASKSANGNGGGGGISGGGGGGGHAVAGTIGNNGGQSGLGGDAVGNTDLTLINFGGGGGGSSSSNSSSTGGKGSSIVIIIAKTITITGSINVNGGNSTTSNEASGGAGAGGSVLLKCQIATLGSGFITSSGQTPPSTNWSGGRGGASSVGRIHLDYSDSFTGTTTPTLDSSQDAILENVSSGGSPIFFDILGGQ